MKLTVLQRVNEIFTITLCIKMSVRERRAGLFDHRTVVFARGVARTGFVGFRDLEFLDTYIAQHFLERCTRSKNDFTAVQCIRIHILFFILTLTAERGTKGTKVTQLNRQMIHEVQLKRIDHAIHHHFHYAARRHSHLRHLIAKLRITHCACQQRAGYILYMLVFVKSENRFLRYIL